jgi:hypothetical protein
MIGARVRYGALSINLNRGAILRTQQRWKRHQKVVDNRELEMMSYY